MLIYESLVFAFVLDHCGDQLLSNRLGEPFPLLVDGLELFFQPSLDCVGGAPRGGARTRRGHGKSRG